MKSLDTKKKPLTVAISGGFDPIHIGHVRMILEAAKLGDKLIVIVNNDNWLRAKKGFVFMPENERKELIEAIRGVSAVVISSHPKLIKDPSVAKELKKLRPDIFANGGDRKAGNTPESEICRKLGIKMLYNVGKGGKIQSSSWLVEKSLKAKKKSKINQ